jgi:hypothetical protein
MDLLYKGPVIRTKNDTCPWRHWKEELKCHTEIIQNILNNQRKK